MSLYLQIKEVLPFYKDPTLLEAGRIIISTLLLVMGIWIFRQVRHFKTEKSNNGLSDDNVIVSPFLIEESQSGDLSISVRKYKLWYKVIAITLILFFVFIPLSELFPKESFYSFSCMF